MIIMKILFLILIIISIFFRILYVWDFSIVLLVISCAIPVFLFTGIIYLKHTLKMNFSVSEKTAEKGQPFTVTLNVENKSIFPVSKAEAVIEYQNTINGDINTVELHFPIQSRNCQKIDFQLTSKFCGKVKIRSSYVMIYDPIRLFKAKTAKNIQTEITIMPLCQEINGYISDFCYTDEESNQFSQTKSGDDPSEVFDFHEYRTGDKPSRIHWKLSSKKDDFIVKELSMPVNEKIIIFPDIRCSENSEYTLPVFDTIMETLISVSAFLLENERPHYIINYDSKSGTFNDVYIDDMKTLYSFIFSAVNNADIKYSKNPVSEFFSNYSELYCSSFICISHEADTETIVNINQNVFSEIKNLLYICKNQNENDFPDCEGINIMSISAGKISQSTAGIEL